MIGDSSLIQNLTKLEVNTIIKDSMTARKMPDPANALLDIALSYAWKMASLGVPMGKWLKLGDKPVFPLEGADPGSEHAREAEKEYFSLLQDFADKLAGVSGGEANNELLPDGSGTTAKFDTDDVCIDVPTFIRLRWAAATALGGSAFDGVDRTTVERIRKNADQLKNMLWRLNAEPRFGLICGKNRAQINALDVVPGAYRERKLLELQALDATTLRKIWEIGVEEIVAQTTIDLDGDTVTRIARRYVSPGRSQVIELHRLGIETAVGYWTGVMKALGTFITDLAGRVTRGG